jgi:large subunit ribosomal protein L25
MYEILKAGQRETGKHIKAKQIRKEGWIPGVIFGKDLAPVHFKVPALTIEKFLVHSGKVFEVEVESCGKHLVNVQELQWDHLGNELVHVAFHKLQAGHKTKITVPIQWVGDAKGHKEGGVVHHAYNEVEFEGLPKDMPEYYEIDVSTLEMNGSFHFSNLTPPTGCVFTNTADHVLVSVHLPKVIAEVAETEGAEVTELPTADANVADFEEKKAS